MLQFTNKVFDNLSNLKNPSKEEYLKAFEKAKAKYEQLQDALNAEKAYLDTKKELNIEEGKIVEELKPYFMQ